MTARLDVRSTVDAGGLYAPLMRSDSWVPIGAAWMTRIDPGPLSAVWWVLPPHSFARRMPGMNSGFMPAFLLGQVFRKSSTWSSWPSPVNRPLPRGMLIAGGFPTFPLGVIRYPVGMLINGFYSRMASTVTS